MYVFIKFCLSGVWFLNPTDRPHAIQYKDRLLFFSPPLGQFVESLVGTHHGWRTREGQAVGRRLWENMVTCVNIFSASSLSLPLTLCVFSRRLCFFPAGRFWRRMNLAPSKPLLKRFFSNPKGKGEYVYICREMRHRGCFGFTAALKCYAVAFPCGLLSVFIQFSVAAPPCRCSKPHSGVSVFQNFIGLQRAMDKWGLEW